MILGGSDTDVSYYQNIHKHFDKVTSKGDDSSWVTPSFWDRMIPYFSIGIKLGIDP